MQNNNMTDHFKSQKEAGDTKRRHTLNKTLEHLKNIFSENHLVY